MGKEANARRLEGGGHDGIWALTAARFSEDLFQQCRPPRRAVKLLHGSESLATLEALACYQEPGPPVMKV